MTAPSKTSDRILSAKLTQLHPAEGNQGNISPLVCIGQQISVIRGASEFNIEALFITPAARVTVILADRPQPNELKQIILELRSWDAERLEELAEDYTWRTQGQAFRIIDIMAAHGYLTFSDDAVFSRSINRQMKNGDFVILSME